LSKTFQTSVQYISEICPIHFNNLSNTFQKSVKYVLEYILMFYHVLFVCMSEILC
jgi:hypothetical protein